MKRSEYISSKSKHSAWRGSLGAAVAAVLTGWAPSVLIENVFGAWAMIALSFLFVVYALDKFVDAFLLLWLAEKERRNEYERAIRPRL